MKEYEARISNYIDNELNECYSIGSKEKVTENAKQIIRILDITVTEEERYDIGWLTSEELIDVLSETMDKGLFTTYVN